MGVMDSAVAFTIRSGLERGYTHAELRSMAFTIPARGVRISRSAHDSDAALHEAVCVLAADDQFFSHTTAARIHGMPLPARLEQEGRVHLASPTGRSRMVRRGVVGHRIKSQVVEVDGMRVEAAEDTFVHLAPMLSVEELVAVGDWLVSPRRAQPLTAQELLDATRRFRGARGLDRARQAISLVRVGAESPRESLLRLLIVRSGLPAPTLQHEVHEASGALVARLDLSWPDLRLAVEYDGDQHFTDRVQQLRDIERLRQLQELGWFVIRVTKHDLADGGRRILAVIADAHARHAARLAA
jgi:hypothetical protein